MTRYYSRATPLRPCYSCTTTVATTAAAARGGLSRRVGDAAVVRDQLLAHVHSKH